VDAGKVNHCKPEGKNMWNESKHGFAMVVIGVFFACGLLCQGSVLAEEPVPSELKTNAKLLELEPNKWFKLHENPKDKEVLNIKHRGAFGACYDSKRGRLVILGSQTRGKGPFLSNSPFFFDPVECKWTRAYPDDPIETYRTNEQGINVAGEKGNHPFASVMNAGIVYDSGRDELVLCHYDNHVGQDPKCPNFDNKKLLPGGQPFWAMNLETLEWKPFLAGKNPDAWHFMFHPSVYDTQRKIIIGLSSRGVIEFNSASEKYERTLEKFKAGTYYSAAVDTKHNAVVCYKDSAVSVYDIALKKLVEKTTPGVRPPAGYKCPIAFDPGIGKTVVVAGATYGEAQTQTWLYDLGTDAWKRLPEADLVFKEGIDGMNMIYDSRHKVCLLVAFHSQGYHSVWALKVDETKLGGGK